MIFSPQGLSSHRTKEPGRSGCGEKNGPIRSGKPARSLTVRPTFLPLLSVAGLLVLPDSALSKVEVNVAFPSLSFTNPVDLRHSPDGTNRLFVVGQPGTIYVFENDPATAEKKVFLNIVSKVSYGGEKGLLGLAFHPNYGSNGLFYVNYTAEGPLRTVVSRFAVSDEDPDEADPESESIILEVSQPFGNHNGGQIGFGPDGYLYVGLGDGGSGGDPYANGQNRGTLLGTLLRIDVDNPPPGETYGIPEDNPFAGNSHGYREEIFAYGLRNPWRFSFDPVTNLLWLADVGQDSYEEIDIIVAGENYGWNIMEGDHCFSPASDCDTADLTLPVWEYDHTMGKSITGGHVYRGWNTPSLLGMYIYGDFISGTVWSLEFHPSDSSEAGSLNPPLNTKLFEMGPYSISSFGVDESRELYLCSFDGRIYHMAEEPSAGNSEGSRKIPAQIRLYPNIPNPFNGRTTLRFDVPEKSRVAVSIFDVTGREVRSIFTGQREKGYREVSWDGRDEKGNPVASGIYFHALTALSREDGSRVSRARKMLLLR